jgi:hypothetical protein
MEGPTDVFKAQLLERGELKKFRYGIYHFYFFKPTVFQAVLSFGTQGVLDMIPVCTGAGK